METLQFIIGMIAIAVAVWAVHSRRYWKKLFETYRKDLLEARAENVKLDKDVSRLKSHIGIHEQKHDFDKEEIERLQGKIKELAKIGLEVSDIALSGEERIAESKRRTKDLEAMVRLLGKNLYSVLVELDPEWKKVSVVASIPREGERVIRAFCVECHAELEFSDDDFSPPLCPHLAVKATVPKVEKPIKPKSRLSGNKNGQRYKKESKPTISQKKALQSETKTKK